MADLDLAAALLDAAGLAAAEHHGQLRKGSGDPYIVHPLRVAGRVLRGRDLPEGLDLRAAALAAVLHDTLEDTELPRSAIAERYGEPVAAIVSELTQDASLPKAERRRKMIEGCRRLSREAKVVKLADRWDNMSEMADMGAEFIARYCAEARAMVEHMRGTWPEAEAEILSLIARYDP